MTSRSFRAESSSEPNPAPQNIAPKIDPRIEDLPVELLYLIIDEVDHEDLQNFAQCCPIVWQAAKKAFDVHRGRRRFCTAQLGYLPDNGWPQVNPVDLLRELISDDGLASYPKEIVIGQLGDSLVPLRGKEKIQIQNILENSRYFPQFTIQQLLEDSFYFPNLYQPHEPGRHVRPVFIMCLLLVLLPNVRSVELRNTEKLDHIFAETVWRIADRNRRDCFARVTDLEGFSIGERHERDSDEPHALSNLTDLKIYNHEGVYPDFAILPFWALLPSLRSMRLKGLHSVRGRYTWSTLASHQSDVTRCELEDCVVSRNDFKELLRSFKGLRYFKYHYGTPQPEISCTSDLGCEPWNPRGLIELLSTHASHSLVTLDLTRAVHTRIVHGDRLAGRLFVGSLRRFRLLRTLRADAIIFIESDLENLMVKYVNVFDDDNYKELLRRIQRNQIQVGYRASSLVKLLPSSLEELVLCSAGSYNDSEVEALFAVAPAGKAQRVPRWNKIVFECRPPSQQALKAWKDVGIQMYCLSAI